MEAASIRPGSSQVLAFARCVSVAGPSSAVVATVGGSPRRGKRVDVAWAGERLVRKAPLTGVTRVEALCVTVSR